MRGSSGAHFADDGADGGRVGDGRLLITTGNIPALALLPANFRMSHRY